MVNKKSALDSDVVLSSIMHTLSILLATENTPIQCRKLTAQLAKFLPLPVVTPEVIVWQSLFFQNSYFSELPSRSFVVHDGVW